MGSFLKDVSFDFDNYCLDTFERLKHLLIHAPVLAHYDPDEESRLETDASDGVVAGVFSQRNEQGEWHPIAFFSGTMAPAELNYEIHDKEMLANIKSLTCWRAELLREGTTHIVYGPAFCRRKQSNIITSFLNHNSSKGPATKSCDCSK
jgi:hypothetical protein